MLRRYELTDQEWKQIEHLFPPENTGKRGRPRRDNRTMLNAVVWIARSGAPWRDLPERYGPWESAYSRFRKWIDDGIPDNIFRVPSMRTSGNTARCLHRPGPSAQRWRPERQSPLLKSGTAGAVPAQRFMQPQMHTAIPSA